MPASGANRQRLLREFLDALDAVDSNDAALREALETYRLFVQARRRYFEDGGTVPAMAGVTTITEWRQSIESADRAFEAARVRAYRALYRLGAADGMNAAEIGRLLGVSRQLVSKVLNDPEDNG